MRLEHPHKAAARKQQNAVSTSYGMLLLLHAQALAQAARDHCEKRACTSRTRYNQR